MTNYKPMNKTKINRTPKIKITYTCVLLAKQELRKMIKSKYSINLFYIVLFDILVDKLKIL